MDLYCDSCDTKYYANMADIFADSSCPVCGNTNVDKANSDD